GGFCIKHQSSYIKGKCRAIFGFSFAFGNAAADAGAGMIPPFAKCAKDGAPGLLQSHTAGNSAPARPCARGCSLLQRLPREVVERERQQGEGEDRDIIVVEIREWEGVWEIDQVAVVVVGGFDGFKGDADEAGDAAGGDES